MKSRIFGIISITAPGLLALSYRSSHRLLRQPLHLHWARSVFFQLIKLERGRRKAYVKREEVRRDIFDYIELFTTQGITMVTPAPWLPEFEKQYFDRLESVC